METYDSLGKSSESCEEFKSQTSVWTFWMFSILYDVSCDDSFSRLSPNFKLSEIETSSEHKLTRFFFKSCVSGCERVGIDSSLTCVVSLLVEFKSVE